MELPKYIRVSLQRANLLYAQANAHMQTVEKWLEAHGIDPDELRDGSGTGLDEVEYAADPLAVEKFIAKMESSY